MKKILILSYFFPPSNFAGSYRVDSFAKYFHKFGYYPVVITRQSPPNANNFQDMAKDCGSHIIHEKHEGYEVYYLPYKGNLRDKIFAKYGDSKFVFARRLLSFFEFILQGLTVKVIPYNNIYFFAKNLIKKEGNFDFLLASGNPYQLFLFCHLLHKKFGIKWIADYRDEWNSWIKYNTIKVSHKQTFFYYLESFFEKKWTKSASLITTVTEQWAKHITRFLGKDCKVIPNGYNHEILNTFRLKTSNKKEDELVFVHLGTVYNNQPIEIFIETVIRLTQKGYKIKCLFPGIIHDSGEYDLFSKLTEKFEYIFIAYERLKQEEVFKMMNQADALLMIGYQNFKGVMSSKVLEYLPWHKPIVMCPSDNGILEDLLSKYSKSFICNSSEDLEQFIIHIFENKESLLHYNEKDEEFCLNFTREKQVEILTKNINKIL